MIDDCMKGNRLIGIVQPKKTGELKKPNLYHIGCVGKITSFNETEDGRYLIILNGICRYKIIDELNNAKGGELSFAIGGELKMGPITLETSAVMMDLRVKTVAGKSILPTWLGVQKNGMDTEFGNNEKHYILPEPGMSFIASLEASI